MHSTVYGKYPLDQHPEPHGASSRALNTCESTCANPTGSIGPTRSASCPTEVNNALTWFGPCVIHFSAQRERPIISQNASSPSASRKIAVPLRILHEWERIAQKPPP